MMQGTDQHCFHCGSTVVEGSVFYGDIAGEQRQFCCPACLAVASTIANGGLESYYHFRIAGQQAPASNIDAEQFLVFDEAEFQTRFVQRQNGHASSHLLIGGMHCAACTWLLENYLMNLVGVERVNVSLTEQKLTVTWQPETISLSAIAQAIAAIGYQPEPFSSDQLMDLQRREYHQALRRLGVAGIGMMQVGMFAIALYAGDLQSIAMEYRDLMRWSSLLITTVVVLYSARPFFTAAWRGLVTGKPGMDLPVAIAIGLAYFASVLATVTGAGEVYFDTVVMFTFLLLGGRFLEMRARHYAGRLSTDLYSLLPSTVTLLDAQDRQQSVSLFSVKPGDRLLVKPGQVIAADGVVVDGYSSVDESQLTGEFERIRKKQGDKVVAGTVNGSNPLTIFVEATGADLQIQTVNHLLAEGRQHKPAIAQLADAISGYFITAVLSIAAITYGVWYVFAPEDAFWITLSVLVVSCPCALSLATPAALTAATHRLRRLGLLVTDAQVWEKLAGITHIVCDKTGTLTSGTLSVSAVKPLIAWPEQHCLAVAASLESISEHPIAQAFRQVTLLQPPQDGRIDVGAGVEGVIDGKRYRLGRPDYAMQLFQCDGTKANCLAPDSHGQWILLSHAAGPICWFQLQDSLREDAAIFVEGLQRQHLQVEMLSGDSSGNAEKLGKQLGLTAVTAGATPEQKLDYIRQLQSADTKVLMLGDGINDVPVLAAADVSVAMANASDLAKTQADCILLSGRLGDVLQLIALARSTRAIIKQNMLWALCYNFSVLPLAVMGWVPPYLAAIGMSLSSLAVVLNALRLQRWQPKASAGTKMPGNFLISGEAC